VEACRATRLGATLHSAAESDANCSVFFAIAKQNGQLYRWNFAGAPAHVTPNLRTGSRTRP
jgi:hypothetical protein